MWGPAQRTDSTAVEQRVGFAEQALDAHQASTGVPADLEDATVFLVADLMHLCSERLEVDFAQILAAASTHVLSERLRQ